MEEKNKVNNYRNWSIEKGDYIRDHETTNKHEIMIKRQNTRKKIIKVAAIMGIILLMFGIMSLFVQFLSK